MNTSKYEASAEDGKEILRILESSAAKGGVELLYTRRPDAYRSYMKEPGEARVFVSKHGDTAIGTCAELIRDVYIDGQPCKAAYICGLKKDACHNGGIGFGASLVRDLRRDDIDFYYCSVVSDNANALKMFSKGGKAIFMRPIAEYKTFILSPRVRVKAPKTAFTFRQATESDREALLAFLQTEGKRKDLFPTVSSFKDFYGLSTECFYLLTDGDCIVAAAALWNQTAYKQYVVKKYRGLMRLARLANPLLCAMGYVKLPKEDAPLDFPMLSFFVSKADNQEYYLAFLSEIKKVVAKTYGMFVLGLPKQHFAFSVLNKMPSISFETKLYEIRFPWSKQDYKKLDAKKAHPECALL